MTRQFGLCAQLSTSDSPADALAPERVLPVVRRAMQLLPLQILLVGTRELPALYAALTSDDLSLDGGIYLWYSLLADYAGQEPSELAVSYRGAPDSGWAGLGEEVGQSFRFSCPSKPAVREKTLLELERLLTVYNFDGVFLDRVRFPSPGSSFEAMLSCFCSECEQAAAASGLTLAEVRSALVDPRASAARGDESDTRLGPPWLDDLLIEQPVIRRFLRFRMNQIEGIVKEVHLVTSRLGKSLALDLFSPGLAPLVGQDYAALANYAAWVKPMSYRITWAPAGLPMEISSLVIGLERHLGLHPGQAPAWMSAHIPGLRDTDPRQWGQQGVPLRLVSDELRLAVDALGTTPAYMGLETGFWSGICEATPALIRQMVATGREAGVAGTVISWDLIHTPEDHLLALKGLI